MPLCPKEEKGVWRTHCVVSQDEVRTECPKERREEGIETKTGRETVTGSAATEIKIETEIGKEGETGIEIVNTSGTGAIGTVGTVGKTDTCPPQQIRRVWVTEVKKVKSSCRHNQKKVHRMG